MCACACADLRPAFSWSIRPKGPFGLPQVAFSEVSKKLDFGLYNDLSHFFSSSAHAKRLCPMKSTYLTLFVPVTVRRAHARSSTYGRRFLRYIRPKSHFGLPQPEFSEFSKNTIFGSKMDSVKFFLVLRTPNDYVRWKLNT